MIIIVKNIIQSRIQKSWTSAKQTTDIFTTNIACENSRLSLPARVAFRVTSFTRIATRVESEEGRLFSQATKRYKGTRRAPNLYTYRDKNKDTNVGITPSTLARCCKHLTINQRKSPNFKCYSNRCLQNAECTVCTRAVLDCRSSTD